MRRPLIALAILGWLVAEIAVVWWLADLIGWLWVLALLAAQCALGVSIAKRAGASAFRGLGEASRSGSLPGGAVGDSALTSLGGALIAMPGLLTDIPAVLLLLPPTRALIRRISGATIGRRITAAGFSTASTTTDEGVTVTRLYEGQVIEGEVIQGNAAHESPDVGPDDEGDVGRDPQRS